MALWTLAGSGCGGDMSILSGLPYPGGVATVTEFGIEFTINDTAIVSISTIDDPTALVWPSTTRGQRVGSDTMDLTSRCTFSAGDPSNGAYRRQVTFILYHAVSAAHWDSDVEQRLFNYVRNEVLPGRHAYFPDPSNHGVAIEYFDNQTTRHYLSYALAPINGTISPVPADQAGSAFEIVDHTRFAIGTEARNLEVIAGRFNCKLYGPDGEVLRITNGRLVGLISLL